MTGEIHYVDSFWVCAAVCREVYSAVLCQLVQIRINIHSFLVQFVTGIHFPLNHAYS